VRKTLQQLLLQQQQAKSKQGKLALHSRVGYEEHYRHQQQLTLSSPRILNMALRA
jgi:hypothetical protein